MKPFPRDQHPDNITALPSRGNETTPSRVTEQLLVDLRALEPGIRSRAGEIEAQRRTPPDMLQALRRIGAYRLFKPRSHGGLELDLPNALTVISEAARIDGSIGWTIAIGSGGDLFTPYLPAAAYDRVYEGGPDTTLAGAIQPAGVASRVSNGWRVSGRWPFASGSDHAQWMMGVCRLMDGDKPLCGPDGAPQLRAVFAPAAQWRVLDTWHVAGLKGTASQDIVLDDVVVPDDAVVDFLCGKASQAGPLYGSAVYFLPLLHGAVSVGMAQGALDDVVALAASGRRQQRSASSMRESEIFQSELGRISAEVRAAVYETSPLQRRLRDMHAAAQHAAAHPRQFIAAGRLLLEQASSEVVA
jgi:alkylation response protein AidB-like acyl-CoA dehydrogenase